MATRLESGGINFAVEDLTGGEGPTVVFVHGLGGSINSWLAQLEACRERGWRAIAYDQRGAGRSDQPPGPYSVDALGRRPLPPARHPRARADGPGRALGRLHGHRARRGTARRADLGAGRLRRSARLAAGVGAGLRRAGRTRPRRPHGRDRRDGRRDRPLRALPPRGPAPARPDARDHRLQRPAGICGLLGGDRNGDDGRPGRGRPARCSPSAAPRTRSHRWLRPARRSPRRLPRGRPRRSRVVRTGACSRTPGRRTPFSSNSSKCRHRGRSERTVHNFVPLLTVFTYLEIGFLL